MKRTVHNNRKRLLAYSAMATAVISGATDVKADIVYVDIPDFTLNLGDFGILDLDGDGVIDFGFILDSQGADWTFIQGFGYLSALSYGNPSNQMAGYAGAFLPYASAFASGDLIGPDLNFLSSTYNLAFIASLYSGSTFGAFGDGTDKFIGVKFDIGGTLHYGWMRVNCTVDPVVFTLKDWAYDDEANVPIPAGATATPLPIAEFAPDAVIVNETDGSTVVNVVIDILGECSVDIDVNDILTTATNGADFTFTDPTTATFAGGTSLTFDVILTDDADFEGSETIVFDLTNPIGCEIGLTNQFTVIINDDEVPLPPLVTMDGTVTFLEESAGAGGINIHVSETTDCVVDYALNVAGTSATEGTDFTYTTGSVTFVEGGDLTQSFGYNIIDDAEVESPEGVLFEITGVSGTCAIGLTTQAGLTITDNDVAPVVGEVSFENVAGTIDEADAVFTGTVTMTEASDCEVTVGVNTGASTATEGTDFTFSTTVLTFNEGGAASQTIDLNILEDADIEADETVVLEITSIDGSCTLDETADALSVVIVNEDFVGIDEFASNGIQLYTYDKAIFIYLDELLNADNQFQLLDANGRVVYNNVLTDKQNKFTLSNLPVGVYIARITNNGKSMDKQVYIN